MLSVERRGCCSYHGGVCGCESRIILAHFRFALIADGTKIDAKHMFERFRDALRHYANGFVRVAQGGALGDAPPDVACGNAHYVTETDIVSVAERRVDSGRRSAIACAGADPRLKLRAVVG